MLSVEDEFMIIVMMFQLMNDYIENLSGVLWNSIMEKLNDDSLFFNVSYKISKEKSISPTSK